jgi:hypothetical protein
MLRAGAGLFFCRRSLAVEERGDPHFVAADNQLQRLERQVLGFLGRK